MNVGGGGGDGGGGGGGGGGSDCWPHGFTQGHVPHLISVVGAWGTTSTGTISSSSFLLEDALVGIGISKTERSRKIVMRSD